MRRFDHVRPAEAEGAARLAAAEGARFLAGGTNLVDLLKLEVETPSRLVDVNGLPMRGIAPLPGGGLRLGALATNTAVAHDPDVAGRYPVLAAAILAGASPQLRNAATVGGNLNQRTRCSYFTDLGARCNKRDPGAGCDAREGVNRQHAVLGASASCVATHPSDMCVALAVLDPVVRVVGPGGARDVAFSDYHRLPGDEPWRDNALERGDLVVAVDLPPEGFAEHHAYAKVRDRGSYAFALVSAAAVLRFDDGGRVAEGRVALGGVAHRPWRSRAAEALLRGTEPGRASFARVADALLEGAVGLGGNDFKIGLARAVVVRALEDAAAGEARRAGDHPLSA